MKKIFTLMIIIICLIGCKNENYKAEKKITQISKDLKNKIEKHKIYIEEIKLKEDETFFIENSAMMEVIETGIAKGETHVESNTFKFDIDYSQLRNIGNKCDKKYDINDLNVLKESLIDSININEIGIVTSVREEAEYSISLTINNSLIIYEGIMNTKGVVGYSFEINNIKKDIINRTNSSFTFEKLKTPIKNSINSIIEEDVINSYCSLNSESYINNNFEKKYGIVNMYSNSISALINFKVVRLLSKTEGDMEYKYQCPMDWYRFFYTKK